VGDWAQYLALPLIGALETGAVSPLGLAISVGSAAALLAYAYVLNDAFDRPELAIPWPRVVLPLAVFLGFLPFLTPFQRVCAILFAGIATAYSLPVTAWKAVPYLCTASNAIGFTLLLGVGATTAAAGFWALAGALCAVQAGIQLVHELADQRRDAAAGRHTTAMRLGPRGTRLAAFGCCCLGAALAWLHSLGLTVALGAYAAVAGWQLLRRDLEAGVLRVRLRRVGRMAGLAIVANALW
jgi:4-hydroxybenzoate polyprenyltransferase